MEAWKKHKNYFGTKQTRQGNLSFPHHFPFLYKGSEGKETQRSFWLQT